MPFVTADQEPILQQRLSGFGLNPTEWAVLPLKRELFAVVHRAEPTLVMVGEVQQDGHSCDWAFLEMLDTDEAG